MDFHTSEHIPAVGARFSKENFQRALKLARLSSINIFAKCHHSWSYHPTKVGRMHPTLGFDLLGDFALTVNLAAGGVASVALE